MLLYRHVHLSIDSKPVVAKLKSHNMSLKRNNVRNIFFFSVKGFYSLIGKLTELRVQKLQ